MRQILNISLPKSLFRFVKAETKKEGFASVSEFMRHLIRMWKQDKLRRELDAERAAFNAGKGKILHSLKDLR